MKINFKISCGLALIAVALTIIFVQRRASATSFPLAMRNDTINSTLLTAPLITTNSTGASFFVESATYHTIQSVNSGTNATQVAIDRSLDGTNWIVVGTNSVAVSGSSETVMTGKWSFVRARFIGTNSPLVVTYLGGK